MLPDNPATEKIATALTQIKKAEGRFARRFEEDPVADFITHAKTGFIFAVEANLEKTYVEEYARVRARKIQNYMRQFNSTELSHQALDKVICGLKTIQDRMNQEIREWRPRQSTDLLMRLANEWQLEATRIVLDRLDYLLEDLREAFRQLK